MNDDAQTSSELDPPVLEAGSPGTEEFWKNLDRANDTEFLHHRRMSKLHQRNVSFAAQQFQSQMLGMMLLNESEMPLISGGNGEQASEGGAAQPPDPTQTQ